MGPNHGALQPDRAALPEALIQCRHRPPGRPVAAVRGRAQRLSADRRSQRGGGSGIGEAIATTLARAGAAVAVADLSQESATRVADAIRGTGGLALPLQ